MALDNPTDRRAAINEVEFAAQMKVTPVVAQVRDMQGALIRAYERIGGVDNRPDGLLPIEFDLADTSLLLQTLEKEGQERIAEDDEQIEQSDNSLVRMINQMIIEAHAQGVSDIHIESYPGREKTRIRFRKDGRLRTHLELPSNYRNAVIARIKIMANLDISERRKPQDGKINFAKFSPQHKIELRVASIPTHGGLEDVVMRLLAGVRPIALDKLGLTSTNLQRFRQAIERPYGMVLCVGPTGSGKTTTLHTNSAAETVTRLLDMGMDPFNFADSLLAVLAQRLVRRLCTQCRMSRRASDDEIQALALDYCQVYAQLDSPPETPQSVIQRWQVSLSSQGHLSL